MFTAKINSAIDSQIIEYEAHKVLVLDNVFSNPDEIRAYAISNESKFQPPKKGSYPGLVLPTKILDLAFQALYQTHIAPVFLTVSAVISTHRFGVTCIPENRLSKAQSEPHRDRTEHSIIYYLAAVTYLFDQSELGGTAFYSELSASDEKKQANNRQPEYVTSTNERFVLDGVSSAKYNRMVIFEASKLHSGYLMHPKLLSSRIKSGRLTLNSFFSSLRITN